MKELILISQNRFAKSIVSILYEVFASPSVMPSATVENYVKAILALSLQKGEGQVGMGEIARSLEVAPGTATSMTNNASSSANHTGPFAASNRACD